MNKLVADAALVHGAGFTVVDSISQASAFTREQTLLGARLVEEGVVESLIVCGRGPNLDDVYKVTEAKAMAEIAEDAGVPRNRIFMDEESVTTLGNWVYGAAIAQDIAAERVLGVSRPSHVARAMMCADFVTKRAGLELVEYWLITEEVRMSSRIREAGQRVLLERFLGKNLETPLAEIPELYEAVKTPLGLNMIKKKRYAQGSERSSS
jgi:vancomycin permeability regulator SanA